MEANAVLISNCSLSELERMINHAVESRLESFYEKIRTKEDPLIRRKEAARLLGVSLPTLDCYGKYGLLHPEHLGGRVYYRESEIKNYAHP